MPHAKCNETYGLVTLLLCLRKRKFDVLPDSFKFFSMLFVVRILYHIGQAITTTTTSRTITGAATTRTTTATTTNMTPLKTEPGFLQRCYIAQAQSVRYTYIQIMDAKTAAYRLHMPTATRSE